MDTKEQAKPRTRRRHDEELKRQVLAQCGEPGASVAKVAMAHGLNANLVHKWRRQACAGREATPPTFVPVPARTRALIDWLRRHLKAFRVAA